MKSLKEGKLSLKNEVGQGLDAFTYKGFNAWNKGKERLMMHQNSPKHKEAHLIFHTNPKSKQVDEMLEICDENQKAKNRKCFMKLVQNLQFLAMNNIAIRGHTKEDSNVFQLAKLRASDDPELQKWIEKERGNYLCPNNQNEVLEYMKEELLNKHILKRIHEADFYTLMCDETTDVSNQEQAVICIRTVNNRHEVNEDFIELQKMETISSDDITEMLIRVMDSADLSKEKLRGQSYDGASNMKGCRNGVVKQIQEKVNAKATYIHCNGHLVNLATSDCAKEMKCVQETLAWAYEIIKLIKKSPKRAALFNKLKESIGDPASTGVRTFSNTRWTVKAKAIKSILDNYLLLIQTFETNLEESRNSMQFEMKSRIEGIINAMYKFETFFGLKLTYFVLRHTDNLATQLQSSTLSAADGYNMAMATVSTLENEQTEEKFENFWIEVNEMASKIGVEEATLPRKRKRTGRMEEYLGKLKKNILF